MQEIQLLEFTYGWILKHAHTHLCIDNTWQLWPLQSFEQKTAAWREDAFEELQPIFWIRPAIWLHFVHEIAVLISWSTQHSWSDLVLAKARPDLLILIAKFNI